MYDGQQGDKNTLKLSGSAHDYKMAWHFDGQNRWLSIEEKTPADADAHVDLHTISIQKILFDDFSFAINPDGSSIFAQINNHGHMDMT